MAHRHRQRRVGTRVRREPFVGELGVVGVVGRDDHHLLAPVARLGHPVRVRGAGDRHVGAPHHQVGGIPPVRRLGDVGLVAEDLRRGDRQVGVPVVERQHRGADQCHEPRTDRVRDHRHGRDRGETGDAVRAVRGDGVHVRGGDHLDRLVPGHPDQPTLTAGPLVAPPAFGIVHDGPPRGDGIPGLPPRLAVHLDQHPAGVRVADAGGGVGVPREGGSARTAAWLVLGPVRPGGRVVGVLRFPGDDAVLDVHVPAAGPGAVHPVRGGHHLVVAPSVAVERVTLAATATVYRAQIR